MNRALLVAGVALLILGAGLFGLFATARASDVRDEVPLVGDAQGRRDETSLVWPIAAGVCLAAGGACVGLGTNRWNASPPLR